MIDYEALARRALDVTPSTDERAALRVWADQLEAAGDPRGTLIALEHAMVAEPHRRRELIRASRDHVIAHATALLGPLDQLARRPRALELDWRAGQLHGLQLNIRGFAAPDINGAELVARVLAAPVAHDLRRLAVRTRGAAQTAEILARGVLDGAHAPPLEELAVFAAGSMPVYLQQFWNTATPEIARVIARYPDLRMVVDDHMLMWRIPQAERDARLRAVQVAEPETAAGRAELGRALLGTEPALCDAALARIEQLGPRAAALADTLMILLYSNTVSPKVPVALALARLGDAARLRLRAISAITGQPAYSVETRRAASIVIAALRERSALS